MANSFVPRLLGVGLTPEMTEQLKRSLKRVLSRYQLSFIASIDSSEKLSSFNFGFDIIFAYTHQSWNQTEKYIHRIHQVWPESSLVLLTSKSDVKFITQAFRSGVDDVITCPSCDEEIVQYLSRWMGGGNFQNRWPLGLSPEKAVLDYFSRPDLLKTQKQMIHRLTLYLKLFLRFSELKAYDSHSKLLEKIKQYYSLEKTKLQKLKHFLQDTQAIFFALEFGSDQVDFLIKSDEKEVVWIKAVRRRKFSWGQIFQPYLKNLLKAAVERMGQDQETHKMQWLSWVDDVTGLFNQRKLTLDLEMFMKQYKERQQDVGFTLLFIDIDYFKNVNDQFGHIVGSQLLIDMARALRTELRGSDLIYRFGGDEFIILLPKTPLEESKKIALRLAEIVKQTEFTIEGGKKYHLSLSIGVAGFPEDADNAKAMIDFADKMMYMSKKSGRGKVFHMTEIVAE